MRALSGAFCLILILFAAVQYNDPDFLYWSVIYGVAAFWCGVAAIKPDLLAGNNTLKALFGLCLLIALIGTVYYWPSATAWWTKEVIWENELVREGLGMAIATLGMALAGHVWWPAKRFQGS